MFLQLFFILAEAKHKIDDKKIAEKLGQSDTIISFFEAAKNCRLGKSCPSTKFAKMVARNQDIAYMEQYILFFGASFWEESLMDDLERDLADRKVMVAKFFELSADRKTVVCTQGFSGSTSTGLRPVGFPNTCLERNQRFYESHSICSSFRGTQ